MTRSQTDQSLNLYTSEYIKRSRNSKSTQFKVETDKPDGGKWSQTCLLISPIMNKRHKEHNKYGVQQWQILLIMHPP